MTRRSYGSGRLYSRRDGRGRETWYGSWRAGGRRVKRCQVDRLASGGDYMAPLHRAAIAGRRGFQVSYDRREFYEKKGFDLTLVWRRGDDLDTTLARIHSIEPDPNAGRAARDAMLPAFEGLDRWVPLPVRQALAAQVEAGALAVEHIEVPDAQPTDPTAFSYVHDRWQRDSPLRRAALAALAYIEQHGGNPRAVHLQGRDIDARDTPHYVSFKWRYYDQIPTWLTLGGGEDWLEIVNPTRTKQLHGIKIVPLDREQLRWAEF